MKLRLTFTTHVSIEIRFSANTSLMIACLRVILSTFPGDKCNEPMFARWQMQLSESVHVIHTKKLTTPFEVDN